MSQQDLARGIQAAWLGLPLFQRGKGREQEFGVEDAQLRV